MKVLNEIETLYRVIKKRHSLCRFGDGEYRLCLGGSIVCQKHSVQLQKELLNIVRDGPKHAKLCVAIPNMQTNSFLHQSRPDLHRLFCKPNFQGLPDPNAEYGSSFVTRNDIIHQPWSYWELFSSLFAGRDLIVVTGVNRVSWETSQFFGKAKSIQIILASKQRHCFDEIEQLYDKCLQQKKKSRKSCLFALMLGPTATVLAYKLFIAGYQAVDIGSAYRFYRNIRKSKQQPPQTFLFCETKKWRYFEDYITSSVIPYLPPKETQLVFLDDLFVVFKRRYMPQHTYIFVQQIPHARLMLKRKDYNLTQNFYVINTEQLSRPRKMIIFEKLYRKINIWDYSQQNVEYLLRKQFSAEQIRCFPCQTDTTSYLGSPKKGIVMMHPGKSPRRLHILQQLADAGITVSVVKGWGQTRDAQLFKFKYLLNIGFDVNCRVFETKRCVRCIENGMQIISDEKDNQLSFPGVTFVSYDNIVSTIKNLLHPP